MSKKSENNNLVSTEPQVEQHEVNDYEEYEPSEYLDDSRSTDSEASETENLNDTDGFKRKGKTDSDKKVDSIRVQKTQEVRQKPKPFEGEYLRLTFFRNVSSLKY